ncbi:hypothetical protein PENTCL1PPCAC_16042, partial [Pristionchus entomophagus]
LSGLIWIILIFIIFLIRQSRQQRSMNGSECILDMKQMLALAFLRCLFTEAAVRMVLFNVKLANITEITLVRDILLRVALALLVNVLSPLIYAFILTRFSDGVRSSSYTYGKNTERNWQSA